MQTRVFVVFLRRQSEDEIVHGNADVDGSGVSVGGGVGSGGVRSGVGVGSGAFLEDDLDEARAAADGARQVAEDSADLVGENVFPVDDGFEEAFGRVGVIDQVEQRPRDLLV